MTTMMSSTVAAFREVFQGEVVLRGEAGYEQARAVWNGMIDRRPALVVRPTHVDDVVAAVRFAREQDLLVAVRGGGHSIPGLSTCDDGIVIDMSRMRGAEVDPGRRTARCRGGALLAELDEASQAHDLVCPVGVVSHTGVAGLALGGGMGRLQRKLGLTIDSLLAVELVTAEGERVRADADENADLFWGLRGAGANFGIATSLEFRLHPLDGAITHGSALYPVDRVHEVAAVYRELTETAPDELMLSFGVTRAPLDDSLPPHVAGRPAALVVVLHCGPVEQAERDLAPLRRVVAPVLDLIRPKTYLEAQHANDEASGWGHRFYMKSGFMDALPAEVVDSAVESVSQLPAGGDGMVGLWSWGRAIARVPDESTAFTGREAAYWVAAEAQWDDPALDEPHRAWGREAMARIAPFTGKGRYVNDATETGEQVVRAIYGEDKYERLRALKRTWDPDNVFRLNQNIRP